MVLLGATRHPFPTPCRVYTQTTAFCEFAVAKAGRGLVIGWWLPDNWCEGAELGSILRSQLQCWVFVNNAGRFSKKTESRAHAVIFIWSWVRGGLRPTGPVAVDFPTPKREVTYLTKQYEVNWSCQWLNSVQVVLLVAFMSTSISCSCITRC